jgi:hypothetical protein
MEDEVMNSAMRITQRFIGYLQYSCIAIFLFGACIAIAFRLVHQPDFTMSMNKNLMISLVFFPSLIYYISILIFYTAKKHDEYLQNDCGTKMHQILEPDRHFYLTIIEDIGIKRKIAGYAYATSKIVLFGFLGAKLCFVATGHFFK